MMVWMVTLALAAAQAVFAIALWVRQSKAGDQRFTKPVEDATRELEKQGFAFPAAWNAEGAIKDLEIQWHDHFHMRDQTWRTLSISAVIFVGIVGLEVYAGTPRIVMIAGYLALVLVSFTGFLVAAHHRQIQQRIKLPIILRYEILLGLVPAFKDILDRYGNRGLSTSTFIVVSHAMVWSISMLLFGVKVYEAEHHCLDLSQLMTCLLQRDAAKVEGGT